MTRLIARFLLCGLLATPVLAGTASAKDDEQGEEQEETLTLAEVPAPVRTTIENETRGGEIKEIERSQKHGRTVYEVEYTRDGKKNEVVIAEDGSVVKRKGK